MTHYSKYKDFQIRKQLKKKELNIFVLKSLLLNENISRKIRFKIMLKIQSSYKHLTSTKFISRCMFSTKVRSVNRITNLTKSTFKDNLKWGNLSGFKKASW